MSDLYLIHSKKGYEKPGHKYLTRVWKNGRWQYVYEKNKPISETGKTAREAMQKAVKSWNEMDIKRRNDPTEYSEGSYGSHSRQHLNNATRELRKIKENSIKSKFYNSKTGKAVTGIVAKTNEKKIKRHTQDLLNTSKKTEHKNKTTISPSNPNRYSQPKKKNAVNVGMTDREKSARVNHTKRIVNDNTRGYRNMYNKKIRK